MSYTTPSYFEFGQPEYRATEDETHAVVTVFRHGDFRWPASVRISTQDKTAQAGSDYESIDQVLFFPGGQSVQSVSIPIRNDRENEPDEAFLVTLSDPSVNDVILSDTATVIIENSGPSRLANRNSAPALSMTRVNDEALKLEWAASESAWILEESSDLAGTWSPVNAAPAESAGGMTVTVRMQSGARFFRLNREN